MSGGGSAAGPCVLVTGGAGFVGTNLADRLMRDGERVRVLDSLARPGVEDNLRWLSRTHPGRLEVTVADVRDARAVDDAVRGASAVFHFAAQVAVTTSLADPVEDFEVNARGTLNVLDALRRRGEAVPLVFTSTNKVYGALEDLALEIADGRYRPRSPIVRARGVGEDRALEFHSPYGCSKGAADQYVLDHARTFGLPALVFRMSCIYGPHQHGNEDQGWVAHFIKAAMAGEPITIYGDGRQVRDVLYVDDLVEAFLLARRHAGRLAGQAFNVGGGPARTVSLRELVSTIEDLEGERPEVRHGEWRAADQRYYVSDTRKLEEATGWRPTVGVLEGVRRLHAWLRATSRAEAVAAPAGAAEVHP
jgi:CDP-paratose 2-epimerase